LLRPSRRIHRRNPTLTIAIVFAVSLVAACSDEEVPDVIAPMVELVRVQSFDIEDRIESTGELRAVERAEIAAEVSGRITEILRDEGDSVAADEVILRIDPEKRELELANVRAQRAEASAATSEAVREQRRLVQLHERGAASMSQLDAANTALESARSRLRAAEAQMGVAERALSDAEVRAPFEALIASRRVSRGEFVSPGTALFNLVAIDPIEVEFHLPERDSGRVALGQSVVVRVAPHPDRTFEARISMVSPIIDPRTRTLRVEARLDNADGMLRPGLFARVDVGVARRPDVIMVPEESVLQRALGPIVFTADADNRVTQRDVEIGIHRRGAVEIVRGVEAGDWVVRTGHTRLIDGLVVRARRHDEPFSPEELEAAGEPVATQP
jgi:membrane fusion protein (multidrug efflux system)